MTSSSHCGFGRSGAKKLFRSAISIAVLIAATACASASHVEYAAYGYLTPGPSSEPELIGVFDTREACEAAGEAWMSRQVVGNPVYAECLPADPN